jgi:ribosomal protein S18 acetylase RimI-like enzyme
MYFRGTMLAARIPADEVTQLAGEDVPKMVALTDLVFPGFFRAGTHRMCDYFGILHEGRLVAMAGERLVFGGHREISAVCTHADYQSRGYALMLVRFLMQRIIQRGERPFLHVGEHNTRALVMYQNLGFASERLTEINLYQRILE